jgi:NAD-dependent deacetylase
MEAVYKEVAELILIGTSAVVQPAASLAYLAKQNGAQVIEINIEQAFPGANYFIREKAGTALPKITEEIKILAR